MTGISTPAAFKNSLEVPSSKDRIFNLLCGFLSASQAAGNHLLSGWESLDEDGWTAVAALAEAEGVSPLLYSRFKASGWPSSAPQSIRSVLTAAYYRSSANYSLLHGELKKILKTLVGAGVSVLVLKGMSLAGRLYSDPALRPMTDLDLLVPRGQVQVAVRLIQGCGYRVQKTTYHTVLWGGPGGKINVELHWSLIPSPSGSTSQAGLDWFWAASEPFEPLPGRILSPEASLLYLSAHLMLQHGSGPRLIWLYDLHLLLTRYAKILDWPLLFAQARLFGWEGALAAALDAVHARLGSPLPSAAQQALAPLTASSPMQSEDFQFWARQALGGLPLTLRLRLLRGLLFPPREYMLWRYHPRPTWLWPLCYSARWAELFREGFARVFKTRTRLS